MATTTADQSSAGLPALDLALLARTSTADNQSPEESLKWQVHRAELATRDVGRIVTIFHDIDESRSTPWKRRPRAQELLAEMRLPRPQRRFDGVVVGEPQRAFGDGLQTATIVPLFVHLGIPLYVPELGGAYDPANDSHDLILGLFGGMSKAERNRIRVRVRSQMVVQAREGRFLGGRPPYGYQLADAGPHPNPAKAADGKRLRRLERDPVAAPVVARIYDMYLRQNLGIKTIAQRLTDDGIPSPSGHDPARNPHRAGSKGAWSRSAVRTILSNPRYLGHQVWHKVLGTDVLFDVEDVTLGSVKRLRPNDPDNWVWSAERAQEPLVDSDPFAAVQDKLGGGTHSRVRRQRGSRRPYALRGLITCSRCGKRLEGDWRHNRAFYRCRLADPAEYARTPDLDIEHPRNAYVREDRITCHIDGWLARLFDPEHIEQTMADLSCADVPEDANDHRAELAQQRVADADGKISRYKAALEAGTDPALVAQWISEAQAVRTAAVAELAKMEQPAALSVDDIEALIGDIHNAFGDMRTALGNAEGSAKGELLTSLGVAVSFDPVERTARVSCSPPLGLVRGRVGGGT